MHQNGDIWSIFAFFFLLEPYVLYQVVLYAKQMRLFPPFDRLTQVFLSKNHPKIEKMAISGLNMAILCNLCVFSLFTIELYVLRILASDGQT